jgi:hypothetical protein
MATRKPLTQVAMKTTTKKPVAKRAFALTSAAAPKQVISKQVLSKKAGLKADQARPARARTAIHPDMSDTTGVLVVPSRSARAGAVKHLDASSRALVRLRAELDLTLLEMGAWLSAQNKPGVAEMDMRIQRVSDWTTGQRQVPEWVNLAVASGLRAIWLERRRGLVPGSAAQAACDAEWANLLDPVLGAFVEVAYKLPPSTRAQLGPLRAAIGKVFEDRFGWAAPI